MRRDFRFMPPVEMQAPAAAMKRERSMAML
jgi:hypothetical protein